MPPSDNQYDFIMQDRPKPKLNLVSKGNSTTSRLLVAVIGFFVVVILVVIAFSVLSSGKSAGAQKLADAAQQQAEIIRVATMGVDKARGRDAKDLAITTQLAMQTDQTALLSILKKSGKKLSTKDLAGTTNAQDDAILNSADQANQFDSSLTALLKQLLTKYQQNLSDAYKIAGPASQSAISSLYNNAGLIISPPK